MKADLRTIEKKLLTRNKWTYSIGGIGRDMIYQLVATFFMVYVQYTMGLTKEQFATVGILLVVGRVWDAVNDPIMGSIVENTHTRWGKFKPWILTGALLTGISVFFMFNFRPEGWGFVIFFGVIYLIWEASFTLNDIPYWSLLPNLAREKKSRDQITTLVVVFAGVGAFLANAIISFTTVGNAVKGYAMISITFVIFFIACTLLTVFGVKEPKEADVDKSQKISIKQMFIVIKNNDQLLWSALALLLYTIGSGLLIALGYNFYYLEIGYNSSVIAFVATFGVTNILIQSFYPKLAKRFKRRTMLRFSFITLAFGYLLIITMGYIPIFPVHLITLCAFGFFIFSGQAIFYMVLVVNMANTIEYNEHKTGNRNEAVVFSLRPFVTKLASALQQGLATVILILTGVYVLSQNVSQLEIQKNLFDAYTSTEQVEYINDIAARQDILDDVDVTDRERAMIYDALENVEFVDKDDDGVFEMIINDAADTAFRDKVDPIMRIGMRLSITLIPTFLIFLAYLVIDRKYFITEEYYEEITKETLNEEAKPEETIL